MNGTFVSSYTFFKNIFYHPVKKSKIAQIRQEFFLMETSNVVVSFNNKETVYLRFYANFNIFLVTISEVGLPELLSWIANQFSPICQLMTNY